MKTVDTLFGRPTLRLRQDYHQQRTRVAGTTSCVTVYRGGQGREESAGHVGSYTRFHADIQDTRKAEGLAARLQERLSSFYLELRGRSLAPGKPGVLERASPGRRLGSIPTPSVSLAPSLRCRGKSPRRWRPGRGKRATEEERVGRGGEIQPSGPSFLPPSFHSLRPFFAAPFGLRFLVSVVRSTVSTLSCDFFALATTLYQCDSTSIAFTIIMHVTPVLASNKFI